MSLPIGRIDLSPYAVDSTPGEDGLVAEISASVFLDRPGSSPDKFYTISSGGSRLVTITDWSDPENPEFVDQLNLTGFFTTSVATQGSLIAVATTSEGYKSAGVG
ncbi:MAG: hypothetical protein VKI81_03525, partial [Synechococcaceae cyanobacterium]|nr:hypothetical protein [Synechococcaceae cyanobacterium]